MYTHTHAHTHTHISNHHNIHFINISQFYLYHSKAGKKVDPTWNFCVESYLIIFSDNTQIYSKIIGHFLLKEWNCPAQVSEICETGYFAVRRTTSKLGTSFPSELGMEMFRISLPLSHKSFSECTFFFPSASISLFPSFPLSLFFFSLSLSLPKPWLARPAFRNEILQGALLFYEWWLHPNCSEVATWNEKLNGLHICIE